MRDLRDASLRLRSHSNYRYFLRSSDQPRWTTQVTSLCELTSHDCFWKANQMLIENRLDQIFLMFWGTLSKDYWIENIIIIENSRQHYFCKASKSLSFFCWTNNSFNRILQQGIFSSFGLLIKEILNWTVFFLHIIDKTCHYGIGSRTTALRPGPPRPTNCLCEFLIARPQPSARLVPFA